MAQANIELEHPRVLYIVGGPPRVGKSALGRYPYLKRTAHVASDQCATFLIEGVVAAERSLFAESASP